VLVEPCQFNIKGGDFTHELCLLFLAMFSLWLRFLQRARTIMDSLWLYALSLGVIFEFILALELGFRFSKAWSKA
jgi:hypothetical protein